MPPKNASSNSGKRSSVESQGRQGKRAKSSAEDSSVADAESDEAKLSNEGDGKAQLNNILIKNIVEQRREIPIENLETYPLRPLRRAGVLFLKDQIVSNGWAESVSPMLVQPIKGTARFRVIEGNHR